MCAGWTFAILTTTVEVLVAIAGAVAARATRRTRSLRCPALINAAKRVKIRACIVSEAALFRGSACRAGTLGCVTVGQTARAVGHVTRAGVGIAAGLHAATNGTDTVMTAAKSVFTCVLCHVIGAGTVR